jgi:NADH:ubiquinone oxidoreductase subunit K
MIPDEAMIILVVAGALYTIGVASLIARRSLIRMVMGIEFIGKGISLFFVLGGYIAGDVGASQAVVITLIAIEAVIAGVALALIILVKWIWKTFDVTAMERFSRGDII